MGPHESDELNERDIVDALVYRHSYSRAEASSILASLWGEVFDHPDPDDDSELIADWLHVFTVLERADTAA